MTPVREPARRMPDFLLSWDRLGFRLLLFGSLGLMWVLQGRMLKDPWGLLIENELASLGPWVFLAPLVLAASDRLRPEKLGLERVLGGHLLGLLVVFIPYWILQRTIVFAWTLCASGWAPTRLALLVPSVRNVVGSFINLPFVYLLILLGAEAMRHARARREEEVQAERLAGQLAEARLALLQRQLHPHFLFNALQAMSTLLHRDPGLADGLLVRLSTLLRAMLDEASGRTLSLRRELELARKYVDIEQIRFQDRLEVEWHVDASLLDLEVPSLVVMPLVENAIRHGLSPKVGPGLLKVGASREGACLVLAVEDDGLGAALPLRTGVGIENTRSRLAAMLGGGARLDIDTAPGQGFRARIRLPIREEHS